MAIFLYFPSRKETAKYWYFRIETPRFIDCCYILLFWYKNDVCLGHPAHLCPTPRLSLPQTNFLGHKSKPEGVLQKGTEPLAPKQLLLKREEREPKMDGGLNGVDSGRTSWSLWLVLTKFLTISGSLKISKFQPNLEVWGFCETIPGPSWCLLHVGQGSSSVILLCAP